VASTPNFRIRTSLRSARRATAASVALALGISACGLSPQANSDLSRAATGNGGAAAAGGPVGAGSLSGGSNAATGLATPAGGGPVSSGTGALPGGTVSTGVPGATTAGGGTAAGGGASSGAGTSGGQALGTLPGTAQTAAYERTGISASVIHIGIHAPETGAAPVPVQAFATGAKLFWENHTVFGHQVVMDFYDDQYNPSVARQVCETMSRQDFLVIGGAGTDQIQACATDPVLGQTHTPYFSAGVTTNGLIGLPYYFAITQTYAAQSPEVYTMTSNLYGADATAKWAVVTENTPNFADTQQSMDQVLATHHVSYCNIPTPKYFSESDASNAVTAARGCGAKVVFLDVDPNFWIDMVREATAQAYFPDWVGPGITNGENLVAAPVCGEQPNIKAAFLSPYMGLDRQPSDFSSENNPPPDSVASERDLEMLVYGVSQAIYYAMLSTGSIQNLTRDNLIAAMPRFSAAYGPQLTVLPTINFNGTHFGGTGAWELKLNCSSTEYDTAGMLSG
jgi:branched-chain amino acid transport system substrate-binding protein